MRHLCHWEFLSHETEQITKCVRHKTDELERPSGGEVHGAACLGPEEDHAGGKKE